MRKMAGVAWLVVLAASGCTFGLGEQASFVTRNLSLSGQLADGAFATDEGTISVAPQAVELERGVVIFLDGASEGRAISSQIRVDGNLGALCPGSRVELRGTDLLVARSVTGAPAAMVPTLSGLAVSMQIQAGAESLQPTSLTLSSGPGTGGFSTMSFTSTSVVDGEERTLEGFFEIARVVEETTTPGWEGDTWEGQPIAPWE
ncbi:MAG: hypothetical protein K8H88_24170 [Sandaracinaceae bacterium]|nr:hypothetical protein [Sandaracinaceae bacterium]